MDLKLNEYKNAYVTLKNSKKTMDNKEYYTKLLSVLAVLNYRMEGYYTCEKIILSAKYEFDFKNFALQHIAKYVTSLPTISTIKFGCVTPYPYHISSNSIVETEGGYLCNMRAVNYNYNNASGDYVSKDSDSIVRTRNYLMNVDKDFTISKCKELVCDDFAVYPCHIMGMEDVRLFGDNYFLCTRLDATENHVPCVCFGNINSGNLKILNPNLRTEKNWLPMYYDNVCNIIYSFDPLTIYHLDLESGETNKVFEEKITKYDLSTFRGSAVPIRYKDGWLMTVHQVFYHKKRHYYHRFVWLSDDYKSIKYSTCFYFNKIGVEFNLGIAHHDKGLIVCYSVDDANPMLSIVDYEYLDNILFTD